MNEKIKSIEVGGRKLTISTGKIARQADGAIVVQYGETMVLATACAAAKPSPNMGFFPLSVEYREKTYAAGKIPGGFFKREGKPSDHEVLTARLTDRPLRPLFPKNYLNETQIIVNVISSDCETRADTLGMIGASAALCVSPIPFSGPIGAVTVGMIDGEFIVNPTISQMAESKMDIGLAGDLDSIMMVEGEAYCMTEDEFLQAVEVGHEVIKQICQMQLDLVAEINPTKQEVPEVEVDADLQAKLTDLVKFEKIQEINRIKDKIESQNQMRAYKSEIVDALEEDFPECKQVVSDVFSDMISKDLRTTILSEGVRLDGRKLDEVRPIWCELDFLPRAHGSAVFTRGETQALGAMTVGGKRDEQSIDTLEFIEPKRFMLHYNFPPFSVGEVGRMFGPKRREIGHGNLAERALKPVLPSVDDFPYTLRIVSEILESNGSSSMATVCAGNLAMMAGGVPLKASVAGIAMGLIKEGNKVAILSDIAGAEDHDGDMDFKVAGPADGINAIQMDLKIAGITLEIMKKALEQAKAGRLHILGEMAKVIDKPRDVMSEFAPKMESVVIPTDKIGAVIGPSGKVIKKIQEELEVVIEIDDNGTVFISSTEQDAIDQAIEAVKGIAIGPEIGKNYTGPVTRVENYGAFVEVFPGKSGMLHISEMAYGRVNKVEDVMKLGDTVEAQVMSVDNVTGKFELSLKPLLEKPEGWVEKPKKPRPSGNNRNRPPRRR